MIKNIEEMSGSIQEIHNIAFAAKNQIAYWRKWGDGGSIGSLEAAFESILEVCDKQISKEEFEDNAK